MAKSAAVTKAKTKPVEEEVEVEVEEEEMSNGIPGFYTVEQAANKVGLSKATIVNVIKTGKIKASKIGGVYLITETELARIDSVRGNTRNRVEISDVVRLPITCPNCDHVIETIE